MDFTNALGFRFRATVSAKLMIMRNSIRNTIARSTACVYMQRMFRGHQGRQMAVLRKMIEHASLAARLKVGAGTDAERARAADEVQGVWVAAFTRALLASKKHHEWDDDDGLVGEPKKRVPHAGAERAEGAAPRERRVHRRGDGEEGAREGGGGALSADSSSVAASARRAQGVTHRARAGAAGQARQEEVLEEAIDIT